MASSDDSSWWFEYNDQIAEALIGVSLVAFMIIATFEEFVSLVLVLLVLLNLGGRRS